MTAPVNAATPLRSPWRAPSARDRDEEEPIDRLLELRGDDLLVEQPRLVRRLRHRDEHAHALGGGEIDGGERRRLANRDVELRDRHRHGVELESLREETALQHLGREVERQHVEVDGVDRQQTGRAEAGVNACASTGASGSGSPISASCSASCSIRACQRPGSRLSAAS